MKSPFKKLRDFAVGKNSKALETSLDIEEEAQDVTEGMQDVEHMRSQYEGLLTNAHIISGAAYDFSRSVQDMASYMMETFGQFIDGEIGNVFSMLAKVQFEISKLLDLFAAHVSQTIITPMEMMMSELQQVQVMKEQYDEKRQELNNTKKDMHKGKPKSGRTESNTQQLTLAKEEFQKQAHILNSRLDSLKQGQSRSLITQAARYHSAQMHLFNKGLASITAMEPVMRQLALEKNIDRSMSEGDMSNVSFHDMQGEGDASKNGGESESLTSSPTAHLEPHVDSVVVRKLDLSSKSAPISSSSYYQKDTSRIQEASLENKGDTKISMYVLPSPSEASCRLASQMPGDANTGHDVKRPLFSVGKPKDDSSSQSSEIAGPHVRTSQQNVRHQTKSSTNERLSTFNELTNDGDLNKFPKIARSYSHSGPITNKHFPVNNTRQSVNNVSPTLFPAEQIDPLYKSGPVSKSSMRVVTSQSSQNISLPLLSPPQISELHKLPLPPLSISGSLIAHSAPLGKRAQETPPPKSVPTSPLPPPLPGLGARSLSIPASGSRSPKLQQGSKNDAHDGLSSPPLQPIILPVTTSML